MPSEGDRRFELMFDSSKSYSDKAFDAADLVIDFATLGEYGLEPVEPGKACEGRSRAANRRSTGSWNAAIKRFATQP
jgi:hypothetical protein